MITPFPDLKAIAKQVPVLSFFTGGGLLDMGFEMLGFQSVWTNEMDPNFASLYKYGMTKWRQARNAEASEAKISVVGRLMDLGGPDKILRQAFPFGPPKLFGIIGGPPCQDFSKAGLQAGFTGTRGSVTHEFCLHIFYMQPAFFVIENVTGLLQKKHRRGFEEIRKFLGEHYLTDYAKLNSLEYGVPQSRERLFLIGLRRNLIIKPLNENLKSVLPSPGWANWAEEQTYQGARLNCKWPSISPLGIEPDVPTCATMLELSVHNCLVPMEDEGRVPNATDRFNLYSDKPAKTPEGTVTNRCFKRLHRYRFSPTACYGNNEVHLHPYLNQRLSVREVLRIQGVDDNYVLPEGQPLNSKFKMISNGVPVPLAYGVARTMARLLQDYCGLKISPYVIE